MYSHAGVLHQRVFVQCYLPELDATSQGPLQRNPGMLAGRKGHPSCNAAAPAELLHKSIWSYY